MAHRDVLDALQRDYAARAEAIRRDLGRSHSADFAEQAQQRQNDEVLEALLAEAEDGLLLVRQAQQRLALWRVPVLRRADRGGAPGRLASCRILSELRAVQLSG